jgi:hypothetical protein
MKKLIIIVAAILMFSANITIIGCNSIRNATDWEYKHKSYEVKKRDQNPHKRNFKYKPKY